MQVMVTGVADYDAGDLLFAPFARETLVVVTCPESTKLGVRSAASKTSSRTSRT